MNDLGALLYNDPEEHIFVMWVSKNMTIAEYTSRLVLKPRMVDVEEFYAWVRENAFRLEPEEINRRMMWWRISVMNDAMELAIQLRWF